MKTCKVTLEMVLLNTKKVKCLFLSRGNTVVLLTLFLTPQHPANSFSLLRLWIGSWSCIVCVDVKVPTANWAADRSWNWGTVIQMERNLQKR